MIFSMIFLFLVLAAACAVIYYLYALFIPALKLKNKDFNDLLVSDFVPEDDYDNLPEYNVLLYEERHNEEIFDSIYRSKINNERILIGFSYDSQSKKTDENFESAQNSDNKNLEKKSLSRPKLFKFWIYCYKLLNAKRSDAN